MRGSLFLIVVVATLLGLTAAKDKVIQETQFEKCSTFGANSKFLCFKTVMDEITVKMGSGKNDGTNDDVTVTVKSDLDATETCTTKLSSALADDWSKGDTEKWGPSYFGKEKKGGCKDKSLTVKRGLYVTVSKSGDDDLIITDFTIDTKSPDKKNKETERFICGNFELGTAKNKLSTQTKLCQPGPYKFMRIFNAVVKIGNDGTDDSVKVGVGSNANEVFCEKKLSGAFTDDWKKNQVETWKTSYFDDCAKKLYKINTQPGEQPRIYVTKDGKDDLKVDGFEMQFDVIDLTPKRIKYTCPGFTLKGDCKTASLCKHTFNNCKMTDVTGISSPSIGVTTRKPRVPTQRPRPPTRKGPAPLPAVPKNPQSLLRPVGNRDRNTKPATRLQGYQIFNATIKIGSDGTDDDVKVGICSDSKTDCCEKKLSRALSDDWKKNKVEKWKKDKFGDCAKKIFMSTSHPEIYVTKGGKDNLIVDSVEMQFDIPGSSVPTKSKVTCPGFSITGDCKKTPANCKKVLSGCRKEGGGVIPSIPTQIGSSSSSIQGYQIFNATVKIGNDGTDDNVKFHICSDSKKDCCEKKLSRTLTDDWRKLKRETWKKDKFGDCAKKVFTSTRQPTIFVTKDGKDDLRVDAFEMIFDVPGSSVPLKIKLQCLGFTLSGDCKKSPANCKHAFNNCTKSSITGAAAAAKKPGFFGR